MQRKKGLPKASKKRMYLFILRVERDGRVAKITPRGWKYYSSFPDEEVRTAVLNHLNCPKNIQEKVERLLVRPRKTFLGTTPIHAR